ENRREKHRTQRKYHVFQYAERVVPPVFGRRRFHHSAGRKNREDEGENQDEKNPVKPARRGRTGSEADDGAVEFASVPTRQIQRDKEGAEEDEKIGRTEEQQRRRQSFDDDVVNFPRSGVAVD